MSLYNGRTGSSSDGPLCLLTTQTCLVSWVSLDRLAFSSRLLIATAHNAGLATRLFAFRFGGDGCHPTGHRRPHRCVSSFSCCRRGCFPLCGCPRRSERSPWLRLSAAVLPVDGRCRRHRWLPSPAPPSRTAPNQHPSPHVLLADHPSQTTTTTPPQAAAKTAAAATTREAGSSSGRSPRPTRRTL